MRICYYSIEPESVILNLEREFFGEFVLKDFVHLNEWDWSIGPDDLDAKKYFDLIELTLFEVYLKGMWNNDTLPATEMFRCALGNLNSLVH